MSQGFGFTLSSRSVTEASGAVTVQVRRTGDLSGVAAVRVAIVAESASNLTDFLRPWGLPWLILFPWDALWGAPEVAVPVPPPTPGLLAYRWVRFSPGQSVAPVTVTIVDDATPEPNETFRVEIVALKGLGVGMDPSLFGAVQVTITEPGSTAWSFASPIVTISEPGGSGTITVVRTGDLSSVATATCTLAAAASAGAIPGVDFSPSGPQVLGFAAGQASASFTVTAAPDLAIEGVESADLALVVSGSTVATATLRIGDAAVIALESGPLTALEAAGTALVPVSCSGTVSGAISVEWTAVFPDSSTQSGTLGFTAPGTLSIPIVWTDDPLVEADQTVVITLSAPTGAPAVLGLATTNLVISDDDAYGTIVLGPVPLSVTEGGAVTIRVLRTGGNASANLRLLLSGTASGRTSPLASLDVPLGSGIATVDIPIAVLGDAIAQGTEQLTVTLVSLTPGLMVGLPATATLDVLDDDPATSWSFSQASYALPEPGGGVSIEVIRSGDLSADTTATCTLSADALSGATPGVDFSPAGPFALNFAPGQSTAVFLLTATGDLSIEGPEGATLTLEVGGVTVATARLEVDDAVVIGFDSASISASEADGTATVSVSCLGTPDLPVQVTWTATPPSGPAQSGVLTFGAAGPQTFVVTWTDDTLVGPGAIVALTLSGLTGGRAILGTALATLTIVEDDAFGTLTLGALPATLAEGGSLSIPVVRTGGNAACDAQIRLSGPAASRVVPAGPLPVNLAALAAGTTVSLSVPNDALAQGNQDLVLTLEAVTAGVTVGSPAVATVMVLDDDPAGGSFSAAGLTFTFPATAPALVLGAGAHTIDTGAGEIRSGGSLVLGSLGTSGAILAVSQAAVGGAIAPEICAFHLASLEIQPGATVTVSGPRALALFTDGALVVNGTLVARGGDGTRPGTPGSAGPGGWSGHAGPGTPVAVVGTLSCSGGTGRNGGGGGGGGGGAGGGGGVHTATSATLGGLAGPGADGTAGPGSAGFGGSATTRGALAAGYSGALVGGSGGGVGGSGFNGGSSNTNSPAPGALAPGGNPNNDRGGGGGGGGAVLLFSGTAVSGTGTVDVRGGGGAFGLGGFSGSSQVHVGGAAVGGGGGSGAAGGGGGGAGGRVLVRPALPGSLTCLVSGGVGGNAGFSGGNGGVGTAGGAAGGVGGTGGRGGTGGNGLASA